MDQKGGNLVFSKNLPKYFSWTPCATKQTDQITKTK